MAITTTSGGSGSYTHGATSGSVTLFTTASTANAIFIVYLKKFDSNTAGSSTNGENTKIIVGPNTAVKILDDATWSSDYVTFWWYVGMIIS